MSKVIEQLIRYEQLAWGLLAADKASADTGRKSVGGGASILGGKLTISQEAFRLSRWRSFNHPDGDSFGQTLSKHWTSITKFDFRTYIECRYPR